MTWLAGWCDTLPRTLAAHRRVGAEGRTVEHSAELGITIVRGGAGYARVSLDGRLDHHAVQQLRTQLGAVLDAGARYLTVDFSDVDYCDEDLLDVLGWAAS